MSLPSFPKPSELIILPSSGAGDHLPVWLLACCGTFTAIGELPRPSRWPEPNSSFSDRSIRDVHHSAAQELPQAASPASRRTDHGHVSSWAERYDPLSQRLTSQRVPLYAISSLIAIFSLEAAFFIDAVRDLYEVCAFPTLKALVLNLLRHSLSTSSYNCSLPISEASGPSSSRCMGARRFHTRSRSTGSCPRWTSAIHGRCSSSSEAYCVSPSAEPTMPASYTCRRICTDQTPACARYDHSQGDWHLPRRKVRCRLGVHLRQHRLQYQYLPESLVSAPSNGCDETLNPSAVWRCFGSALATTFNRSGPSVCHHSSAYYSSNER